MKWYFVFLIFLIACGTTLVPYERSTEPIVYSTGNTQEEKLAFAMWEYGNEAREEQGLLPLYWDEDLMAIAMAHSTDMNEFGYYDHTNLDGLTATDRARAAGYPLRKVITVTSYSEGVSENLGQVRPGEIQDFRFIENTVEDMAQAQIELWLNSPAHRKNLLDPNKDLVGIGVVWNGSLYLTTQVLW